MKMRALLIGGSGNGKFLAKHLLDKGCQVTAVNPGQETCLMLAELGKLTVIHGDGSNPCVLEEADAYDADLAVALTGRDDDNLVICELCKKKFRVKMTAALLSDPQKTEFFYHMDIDFVVCAAGSVMELIDRQLELTEAAAPAPSGEGSIKVTQVPITGTAPAANKRLWEINLPKPALVVYVLRGGRIIQSRDNTRVLVGDVLVLVSPEGCEGAALRELVGQIS